MKKQDFSNHIRYYPPHHFIFYPLVIIMCGISVAFALKEENSAVWWMISAIIFIIGWLSFMMRQHYALTIQDRVVRLEMRYRYYRLTQKAFEPLEKNLSFGQVAALRFAPDEELPALVEKTITEKLKPTKIKASIINWQPDTMRV